MVWPTLYARYDDYGNPPGENECGADVQCVVKASRGAENAVVEHDDGQFCAGYDGAVEELVSPEVL